MHAQRQAIALGRKRGADGFDVIGVITQHMQDRPEHLAVDLVE